MNPISCSVGILTLNSRPALEKLLPLLVGSFDDVFLCDGNSTDGTVEYAQRLGVRVEKQFDTDVPNQRITDFGAARRLVETQAKRDWIFYLDSDEIPTPELIQAIGRIVAEDKHGESHRILRIAQLPDGRMIQRAFFYPDFSMRLYRRSSGGVWAARKVHEKLNFPKDIRIVDHQEQLIVPWPEADVTFRKSKRYLTLEAEGAVSMTFFGLVRWVWIYQSRSFIGQTYRMMRESLLGYWKKETPLPWRYNIQFLYYHLAKIVLCTKAWIQAKLGRL